MFTVNAANYDNGNQPYWLQRRPSAIEVETSGYALLAHLALHDYQKAGRIALWLSQQQNYDGGFVSTQVTEFFTTEVRVDASTVNHKRNFKLF